MLMTLMLSAAACVLLFLGIWGVTVTMPTALLAKNFPKDVQEKIRPRLESLPMSPKRALGWIILALFVSTTRMSRSAPTARAFWSTSPAIPRTSKSTFTRSSSSMTRRDSRSCGRGNLPGCGTGY